MGTRALVRMTHDEGGHLVTIYRQFDGYPAGLGADIMRILGKRRLVNGISLDEHLEVANGMDDAAALLVAGLKWDGRGELQAGNVYIMPEGTRNVGEEYMYHISGSGATRRMQLLVETGSGERLYQGWLDEFDPEDCE